MKKIIFLFVSLFLCIGLQKVVAQQIGPIVPSITFTTHEEALFKIQEFYSDTSMDIYEIPTESADYWEFFVDEEPQKGWGHICARVSIPKRTSLFTPNGGWKITESMEAPNVRMVPVRINQSVSATNNKKPVVPFDLNPNINSDAPSRTYAIILSGGINMNMNYERYWNDCSFIYQTLVNKYAIPKNHIEVLMADGQDPAEDMLEARTGNYKSSPLDLDNDGKADIGYAATYANVYNVMNKMQMKLKAEDHLFIFVIDHGGWSPTGSYICLWNNEQLSDIQMKNLIQPLVAKSVNVSMLLGQCYSGGFVQTCKMPGVVVATACRGDEVSYACGDIPYDEFVYQWTCALNQADHLGNPISSDTDKNNSLTLLEAFEYAKAKDRKAEHPQYSSMPESIGEDLSFNSIPEPSCLYMKDTPQDTGKEPNLTSDIFWDSPDVWTRNNLDGIEQNENLYYSSTHTAGTVYVKIRNRGKSTYTGGQYVHIFCAQASLGLSTRAWKGKELNDVKSPSGIALMPAYIPGPIASGDSIVIPINFGIPYGWITDIQSSSADRQHVCVLAQILPTSDMQLYSDKDPSYFDVIGDNKIAQRNTSIIPIGEHSKNPVNVYVRNVYPTTHSYSIEIRERIDPNQNGAKSIFSLGVVNMQMTPKVSNAWVNGGKKSIKTNNNLNNGVYSIQFTSEESRISGIKLAGNDFDKIAMTLKLKNNMPLFFGDYVFDLLQRDENDNIVGGETFVYHGAQLSDTPLQIEDEPSSDGTTILSCASLNAESTVLWYDGNGELISQDSSVRVRRDRKSEKYTLFNIDKDGFASEGSIVLEPAIGIKSVNVIGEELSVELATPAYCDYMRIRLSSIEGDKVWITSVDKGVSNIKFNVPGISSGMYAVTLLEGEIVCDSKTLRK